MKKILPLTALLNLLSFLAIWGISLFIATGTGYLLLKFLPFYVSIWGIIGFASIVAYFTIKFIKNAK